MNKFANIAIALPIDKLFQYKIPEALYNDIAVGKRVFVPFGPRTVVGYVVDISDEAEVKEPKDISGVIDKDPVLGEEMLKLTKWIGENYFCSWGEAIVAAIPGGIKKGKESLGSRIKEPQIAPDAYAKTEPYVLMEEQSKALRLIV